MIRIVLQNATACFRPGDTISGTVEWSDVSGDALEVRLIWFTQGKGDRDFSLVDLHQVSAFGAGSDSFKFVAPHRPQSFSGKLVSLQWAIEAIVFPDESAERLDLTISNSGKEIDIFSTSSPVE